MAAIDQHITSAALQEFMKNGYGATSLAQIVRAAGISKTTLYARFPVKAALFRAIMHEQIDASGPATILRPSASPNAIHDGLLLFACRMLEASLSGHLLALNRLICSESHRFPELGAAAAEKSRLGIHRVSLFISDCAAARRIACTNADDVAEAFIHMLRGWYMHVMLSNQKVSKREREAFAKRAVLSLFPSGADFQ